MSWIDLLGIAAVVTPVLVCFGMIAWKAEQRATMRREDWERRFREEEARLMVEELKTAGVVDEPPPAVEPEAPVVRRSVWERLKGPDVF